MSKKRYNHFFSLLYLILLNISAIIFINETHHFHAIVAFLIIYSSVNVCFVLSRLNRIETFHQQISQKIKRNKFIDEVIELFDIKAVTLFWGIFYLTSFLYSGIRWFIFAIINFLIAYTIGYRKRCRLVASIYNK